MPDKLRALSEPKTNFLQGVFKAVIKIGSKKVEIYPSVFDAGLTVGVRNGLHIVHFGSGEMKGLLDEGLDELNNFMAHSGNPPTPLEIEVLYQKASVVHYRAERWASANFGQIAANDKIVPKLRDIFERAVNIISDERIQTAENSANIQLYKNDVQEMGQQISNLTGGIIQRSQPA